MRQFSQLKPSDFIGKHNMLHFIANPEVAILVQGIETNITIDKAQICGMDCYGLKLLPIASIRLSNCLSFVLEPDEVVEVVTVDRSTFIFDSDSQLPLDLFMSEKYTLMHSARKNRLLTDGFQILESIDNENETVGIIYSKPFELWGVPPLRPLLDSVG